MTKKDEPIFYCETCGRAGDYLDFVDLSNDDIDPFSIYTVCSECLNVMRKNELVGIILLALYLISCIFVGLEIKNQLNLLFVFYTLNFVRRVLYFRFLKNKIRRDNKSQPKEFLFTKTKEQIFLFFLTPLDLITSPFRFFIHIIL